MLTKILKALIKIMLIALLPVFITILGLPFLAPFMALVIERQQIAYSPISLESLPSLINPLFYFDYAFSLYESNHVATIASVFAVSVCMIALAIMSYRFQHPDRDVKNGVLGKQRVLKNKAEIISSTSTWNGKSKPPYGVVLGHVNHKAVVFPCIHAAICAPSGAGKTRSSVYPTLDVLSYKSENNFVITDPSMEIYITSNKALLKRGYKIILLDLENPLNGKRFNPLQAVTNAYLSGNEAEAESRAREIGAILFPEKGGDNDIFINAAAGAFSAVAFLIATSPTIEAKDKHIWSVAKTLLAGTTNGSGDLKDWIRSYGLNNPACTMAATFLASEGKLENSILSSLIDGLQPYTSKNIRWLTSVSDMDFQELLSTPTALFIHTLEPLSPTNRIAALFFSQHWSEVQKLGKRRNLRPCWIIGDEWHSVPKFSLVHAIENARKYGLHYIMYTQSFSGYDQYKTTKEDGKDAILSNCDIKALYKAGSILDAQYFEKLGGNKTVRTHSSNTSHGSAGSSNQSQSYAEHVAPVWAAGDVLARNPQIDGVLVFQSANNKTLSRKYEIPIKDVTKTFTKKHFETVGTPDFERKVIDSELSQLEKEAACKSLEVTAWVPDFTKTNRSERLIEEDELRVWD